MTAPGPGGNRWALERLAAAPQVSNEVRLLASLTGYGITIFVVAWSLANRGLAPDLAIWDRVGDQARSGISPYAQNLPYNALFFYSPPWALAFGAASWLPTVLQAFLVFALEVVSLRYVAGSWVRVGYFGLCFVTGGELANGSFNLVLAAGVLLAVRGQPWLAVIGALAKVSPALAIRQWRRAALALAVCVLVTLPVAGWWLDWVRQLQFASTLDIGFPIPELIRLPIALLVMAIWRSPRARILAAAIAVPSLTIYSVVLLYPLFATGLGLDEGPTARQAR
jgi:hypothetical protein